MKTPYQHYIEIHNPETPSYPAMQTYLGIIEQMGFEYIGFIPDLGCFANSPTSALMKGL